jgi:outer membrane protein OmpA-like peptidoglycan-associated protein
LARKPGILTLFVTLIGGVSWSLALPTGSNEFLAEQPAYSASVPPEFEIRARRGNLTITAHTQSARHEERLKQVVSENFPNQAVRFAFRPLGVAPDWWEDATAELITALAEVDSPGGKLHGNSVQIRGVLRHSLSMEQDLKPLRQAMPGTADFDIRFIALQAGVTARALCERPFATIDPGAVKFEESGTDLRESAFPVLDRIIALADACRDSTVSITGHTDSSGNEEWNRQLSRARAETVARYLADRGIDRQRLVVIGAGSSLPVADNATRYGRSLNRRIEIRLSSKDPDRYSGVVSLTSSISNSSVALGGTGGLPRAP